MHVTPLFISRSLISQAHEISYNISTLKAPAEICMRASIKYLIFVLPMLVHVQFMYYKRKTRCCSCCFVLFADCYFPLSCNVLMDSLGRSLIQFMLFLVMDVAQLLEILEIILVINIDDVGKEGLQQVKYQQKQCFHPLLS